MIENVNTRKIKFMDWFCFIVWNFLLIIELINKDGKHVTFMTYLLFSLVWDIRILRKLKKIRKSKNS